MYFGESKRDSSNSGSYNANSYGSQPTYNSSAPASSAPTGGFAEMDDGDGELPF